MAQGRRQKKFPRSKDRRPYITDQAFDLFVYLDETCLKNTPKDGPVSYGKQTLMWRLAVWLSVSTQAPSTPQLSLNKPRYATRWIKEGLLLHDLILRQLMHQWNIYCMHTDQVWYYTEYIPLNISNYKTMPFFILPCVPFGARVSQSLWNSSQSLTVERCASQSLSPWSFVPRYCCLSPLLFRWLNVSLDRAFVKRDRCAQY